MVYLLGVNLPDEKLARVALQKFYGIGPATAHQLCNQLQIHKHCKLKDVSDDQLNRLGHILGEKTLESELRTEKKRKIEQMIQIGTVRGQRHALGLPVHGQKTRHNARSAQRVAERMGFIRKFSTYVSLTLIV
jgi:small subunit ribosomal protein S13